MDVSTIVGLIAVILVMARAVSGGGAGIYDGMSLLIVLVGGIAATLVAYPFREAVGVLGVLKNVFRRKAFSITELIQQIVGFAETARREGILALEAAIKAVDDTFLTTGLRLAVDGTHPELIQAILETEVSFVEERHNEGQRLLKTLGIQWAIFGGIGALVVLAMAPGGEVSGHDLVSRAAVPVLYGLLLAGLFAVSFRRKLAVRSKQEILVKRMIMEGIMSIQSGDNPRIVEQKLNVFIAPRLRGVKDPSARKPAPPAEAGTRPVAPAEMPQPDPELQQQTGEMVQKLRVALQGQRVPPGSVSLDQLLSLLPEETREEILKAMGEAVPEPADRIFAVAFEDIAKLADREIQMILRNVDAKDLVVALKGASGEVIDRIFSNVSERVGAMLKEEMMRRKRVRLRDVVDQQVRILRVIQKLQG